MKSEIVIQKVHRSSFDQAFSMVGHLDDLFGRYGIVAWSVNSANLPPGVPNLAWLDQALRSVGIPAGFVIPLVFAMLNMHNVLAGFAPKAFSDGWSWHDGIMPGVILVGFFGVYHLYN